MTTRRRLPHHALDIEHAGHRFRIDMPAMMTVTAGRTLGFILRRGDNVFEAFDRAERSLDVFEDQRSAADAISAEVAQ